MRLYLAGHYNNSEGGYLISYHDIKQKREDMRLYLAGGENRLNLKAIRQAGGDTSLYSYFYLKKEGGSKSGEFIKDASISQRNIFIDSGGYSVFTRGVKIDIAEYSDWLFLYLPYITTYAVLDKIGDHKETEKNLIYMERRGLKPLPVFHRGSPFEVLRDMIQTYNYIALGNMVSSKQMGWPDKCFSIIQNKAKVHGFGMTGMEVLKRYPFYSVDSTRWLKGSMHAEIDQFKNGMLVRKKTKNQNHADYTTIPFNDNGDKRWYERSVNNAKEMIKYERYITELWAARGIVWN